MTRKLYDCEFCRAMEGPNNPLFSLHDGAVLLCKQCFMREIGRAKIKVAEYIYTTSKQPTTFKNTLKLTRVEIVEI